MQRSLSIVLILGLMTPAWARYRDDDFLSPNRNTYQSSYKPPQQTFQQPKNSWIPDTYKLPAGRLNTDDRHMIRAVNALNPSMPSVSIKPLAPTIAPKLAVAPVQLQFKAAAPKAPVISQAIRVKTGFVAGVQKVLSGVGKALATVGVKVMAVIRNVVQSFRKPEPSAMVKGIEQRFPNVQAAGPGKFQATGGQVYAQGKMWEPGSTFKAAGNGRDLTLIEGVTSEKTVGGLERADGRLLPMRARGTPEGMQAVGIDFNRVPAGTALKAVSPVEIPQVGTIQASRVTYAGQKNGNPLLEIEGKGKISVESITDKKVMQQAEQRLSMRVQLQNESWTVKEAVVETGGQKHYLDGQGKATAVGDIQKRVNDAVEKSVPMAVEAKKLSHSQVHNGRAVNALMKNLFSQTGHEPGSLQATGEAKKHEDAVNAFSQKALGAEQSFKAEDYGKVIDSTQGLGEQASALQQAQEGLKGQTEVLRGFSKALSDLTGDLKSLSPKISRETMVEQKGLRQDVIEDRAGRFFPEEKGRIREHTAKALEGINALVATAQVDGKTAEAWKQKLETVRDQLLGAVPAMTSIHAAEEVAEVLSRPQAESTDALSRSMDAILFSPMNALAEKYPRTMGTVGTAGYYGSQGAKLATQGFGLATLGYFAWTATLATGGALLAEEATRFVLRKSGVNEDASGFYGATAGLAAGMGLGNSRKVASVEGRLKGFVKGWAEDIFSGGMFQRLVGNNHGYVVSRELQGPKPTEAPHTLPDARGPTESGVVLRDRVMKNLAESKTAREASRIEPYFKAETVVARQVVAHDFYRAAGWTDRRINNHIKGIDFNQPVEVVLIKKGTIWDQHGAPDAPTGNYFAEPGTPAKGLGVYPHGTVKGTYEAQADLYVLRSKAANITDTWSVPGWDIEVPGGQTQYFVPDPSKMKRITP